MFQCFLRSSCVNVVFFISLWMLGWNYKTLDSPGKPGYADFLHFRNCSREQRCKINYTFKIKLTLFSPELNSKLSQFTNVKNNWFYFPEGSKISYKLTVPSRFFYEIMTAFGTNRSILRSSKVWKYTWIYRSILLYISNLVQCRVCKLDAKLIHGYFVTARLCLTFHHCKKNFIVAFFRNEH